MRPQLIGAREIPKSVGKVITFDDIVEYGVFLKLLKDIIAGEFILKGYAPDTMQGKFCGELLAFISEYLDELVQSVEQSK